MYKLVLQYISKHFVMTSFEFATILIIRIIFFQFKQYYGLS